MVTWPFHTSCIPRRWREISERLTLATLAGEGECDAACQSLSAADGRKARGEGCSLWVSECAALNGPSAGCRRLLEKGVGCGWHGRAADCIAPPGRILKPECTIIIPSASTGSTLGFGVEGLGWAAYNGGAGMYPPYCCGPIGPARAVLEGYSALPSARKVAGWRGGV